MDFDLVVTARDRRDDLARFLCSLANQADNFSVRVLFADQRESFDDSLLLTEPFKNVQLQRVYIGDASLSKARNEAIRIGLASDIVAFPDDDCWYPPGLLSSIGEIFRNHVDIDCVCVDVRDPIRNVPIGKRPKGHVDVSFRNVFKIPISVGIFMRRTAFVKVGPFFDEKLGVGTAIGSGEETELMARVLSAGCRVKYFSELEVFHPAPLDGVVDPKKTYSYGIGFGYVCAHLIAMKNVGVLRELCDVLARSLLGAVRYAFDGRARSSYWARFSGILHGVRMRMKNGSH